jgi:hypothetical protein
MSRADPLKAEGLMLQAVYVDHMRMSCKMELPIVSVCSIWTELGKAMAIVGPGSHKAFQAEGFRGYMWKDIKGMGRDDVRELGNDSRGRWGCIPGGRGRISVRQGGRKSRVRLRT